ncbi:hypothetical protein TTHERM_00621480 (macronuclear) [Tetrahymena thermophila SB210]|uniref:Uncharacterized protein n=1 Tax=Tetrahymena thermophila (strain SB210) TaxID=312017 RepID=Q23MB1_TETTS|nr:hypothetical protein TTHERM_00621480 [Tetrahymena thermophila SB210]EAR97728.2 hypothetical protein TTHERM_00621480 [Tetrahymena thermophila SB210]|eukprot:XP_001017973.2 hypothetical protein TTHERM_00621480 [Tetrahymena thermophila SB210]
MNKGFNKNEMYNFVDDKVPFTESYNSSLIRLDSFESEKDMNKHSKKNDKKSLFLKYGPIDGNIIYTYGIDAKIGKKGSNKERTYTIYEEEKLLNFLKQQDIQRRKSAEGSQFGFLNKRIIALDNLAPFHPNYKPPVKHGQDKFFQDQSPSRRIKDSQKTRIHQQRESIDMYGDNKMQKRLSAIHKQNILSNIVNNTNSSSNNNKIDYVLNQDSKVFSDKIPIIALSQQKRNSRNGAFLKQIPSNTGSPTNASSNNNNNQFHQTQSSFVALDKTPSKSTGNQQQILNDNPQKQNTDKLNFSSQENEIQESNKNVLNQRKKLLNEPQSNQKTLISKSRRTHTHQDLSDIQNNTAVSQNQKLNQIASNKQLKTQGKDDNSHSSPTNMAAVFFSVHKNSTKQSIQKYINSNGLSTTTTLGSTSFQEKVQQEKSLQTIDLTKKDDFRQTVANNLKKEKLLPLNLTDKKQLKSSQQLFSSVYISQNPLYKKKINQGKRVTLPDIHFQKTSPINQQKTLKTISQFDQKDREPLIQKSMESTNNIQSPNNKSQKFDTTKKIAKKIDYKNGETQALSKNTENSETKLNFRKQSLKQLKKQEISNSQTKKKLQPNQQFIK